MATELPLVLYKYESRLLTGQIIDPENADQGVNLATANGGLTNLEFEIKSRPGGADPALFHWDLVSGITLTDSTLGKYSIQVNPSNLGAIPAGNYYVDLMALFADGTRLYPIKPRVVQVRDVVNPPNLG
jgi:hypothetical protein